MSYLKDHLREVQAAAARIAPHVRRTPLLGTDLAPNLRLKPECFQVTGSFKPRGAFNAILQLAQDAATKGVIAVSSGNHAQAVALAARVAGLPAVVLIPEDANPAKVAATRALGAEVIQEGITFANREQRVQQEMAERGLTLVHPFDDWDVIHGQGTAAKEVLEDDGQVEVVVTPVGGGGLLAGTALVVKASRPRARVVGVEPEAANDAYLTLTTGRLHTLPAAPTTLADGVRTVSVGRRNFEVLVEKGLADAIVTVTEEEIKQGLRTAWTRLHLALEPTGALPLAAYLAGKLPDGAVTGLILSGGNAGLELVSRLLREGSAA